MGEESAQMGEESAQSQIAAIGAIAPIAVHPFAERERPTEPAQTDQTEQPATRPATWSEMQPAAGAAPAAAAPRSRGLVLRWIDGNFRYFDGMAILESFVAIASGILVWLGLWDLFTVHIFSHTVGAKLSLVAVSVAALYGNRTLYDKQLIQLRAKERERRLLSTGAPAAGGSVEPASADSSSAGAASREAAPAEAGSRPTGLGPLSIGSAATAELLPRMPGGRPGAGAEPARMRRLYFDAPPFNLRRLSRATFALFANLSVWIGMYDTLDYHLIPALFPTCAGPERPCALVKGGCILLGLYGLYWTRALYGEVDLKCANFQRMS